MNTAKIKVYYSDGIPIEFDGEPTEIVDFLLLAQRKKLLLSTAEGKSLALDSLAKDRADVEHAKNNMPSLQNIKKFILDQPNYEHDTFDIQRRFFDRTFKARGVTEGLYHVFRALASKARKEIEEEQNGKFTFGLRLGRHKKWRWVPAPEKVTKLR